MSWTADNLKWFFEQPAPRQVDDALLNDTLDVLFPKTARMVLYLSPLLMLVVMGILVGILFKTEDLKGEWRIMTESTTLTSGQVLNVEMQKGSRGSVTYVYRFDFKPVGRKGVKDPVVRGVCFSSSQVASNGQSVLIEYLPDDPKVSRIQGCRLPLTPLTFFIVIPFVAVITSIVSFAIPHFRKKWLKKMLTYGTFAQATIQKITPGAKGALVVDLRHSVGGREMTSKTNVSGGKETKEWLSSLQEAGGPFAILVDPNKPESIFTVETLLNAKRKLLSY